MNIVIRAVIVCLFSFSYKLMKKLKIAYHISEHKQWLQTPNYMLSANKAITDYGKNVTIQ